MPTQAQHGSDFKGTYAVHAALKAALKAKLFASDADAKKAAEAVVKRFESDKTIYGRQCKMIRLMEKGASLDQLRKGLNSSRRTIFRYFLELEQANIDIVLDGTSYRVSKGLLRLV